MECFIHRQTPIKITLNCLECRKQHKATYETRKKTNQKSYLKNKEKILKRNREKYKKTKGQRKEYLLHWARNNKDKIREYKHRRRARERNGNLTSSQIKQLFFNHPYCEYCKKTENLTLDHIIPVSRGGENTLSNVTVACQYCNASKHNKLLEEWRGRTI